MDISSNQIKTKFFEKYIFYYITDIETNKFYIYESWDFLSNKNKFSDKKYIIEIYNIEFLDFILIIHNNNNNRNNNLHNDLIEHLDTRIENNNCTTEKWAESSNVKCKSIQLSYQNDKRSLDLDKKIKNLVYRRLNIIYYFYKKKFNIILQLNGDNGYKLRKIHGKTRLHSDGLNPAKRVNNARILSIIYSLNNFDGGEIHFPIQKIKYKLTKDKMICFPPYWMHKHMVDAPLNNTFRYTINTWILK